MMEVKIWVRMTPDGGDSWYLSANHSAKQVTQSAGVCVTSSQLSSWCLHLLVLWTAPWFGFSETDPPDIDVKTQKPHPAGGNKSPQQQTV